MSLQKILIQLRGEESIPCAAKRIGISPNYYRNLENGIDSHRGNVVSPSADILKRIAFAYKIDYFEFLKAAGLYENQKYNPDYKLSHFEKIPKLLAWYQALPEEDIEEVKKLFNLWQVMKGKSKNVL